MAIFKDQMSADRYSGGREGADRGAAAISYICSKFLG